MSDIINKVHMYLNQVSKEPVEISDKLVEEFGEACKSALRKQFTEQRKSGFQPRMSNIGRPLCQLQMEARNIKGEGQPYNVKMRNTFGDLVEALAIFVMKSAGVKIEDEQKRVKYKFNGSTLEGRYDVKIDKKVWDVKSASPYSFEKKFGPAGGFEEVVKEDTFGYASQGYLYGASEKVPFGGWIVINKSTGEWLTCETPLADDEYKNIALKTARNHLKDVIQKLKKHLEQRKQVIKFWALCVHIAHTNFLVGEVNCNCCHSNNRKVRTLNGFGILRLIILKKMRL